LLFYDLKFEGYGDVILRFKLNWTGINKNQKNNPIQAAWNINVLSK